MTMRQVLAPLLGIALAGAACSGNARTVPAAPATMENQANPAPAGLAKARAKRAKK